MAYSIKDIAAALGAEAFGAVDLLVARPAEPASATADELALAMTPAYADALATSKARAAVVWPGADWESLGLEAAIAVPRARLAMAHLTQAFAPARAPTGIDSSAVICTRLSMEVSVGPLSMIDEDVTIGAGTQIASHVSIGRGAQIGANCIIHAGVRIGAGVQIGNNCILQPNAVIGADGFSFVTAGPSNEERALAGMGRAPLAPPDDAIRHRIHSLGSVVISDDVEVGANSTVDAGTIRPTRVGRGTKIDNLVQVGHNVIVGEDCVLCAQAAVAGSTVLGDRVVMGGKSGIKDNVKIGADVVLGGGAIVLGHVADGQFVMGYSATDMPVFRATQKALRKLLR
jgi:UDP-3-O-[3-hydroxymyristoyl] glucosamine N-acyltransferase